MGKLLAVTSTALLAAAAGVGAAGPAHASTPATAVATHRAASTSSTGVIMHNPARPGVAAGVTSFAAHTPTVSPAAPFTYGAPGTSYRCNSGNLCESVWDPVHHAYRDYRMYYCHRYYLSYWSGTGSFVDNQTGGVKSSFYGQRGNVLRSFRAPHANTFLSWSPVWSIRNC